ncbi:hypothetical protein NAT51_04080 [Flavobacterium amniphilum]|uniref:HYC_CC_PP family protein n=1 Tax=Flavobacterium amniphilum TaxID=1834035 RepID=UPI00202A30B7|nr:hypothetical protein [Flavobacterium amniphilum]MCL9804686.1 hypothetical protein [Flavobacterium amniphilum]
MKIKKHIVIVLSFLILVSNVGLAFNVHYCAGELSGVSFAYRTDDSCTEKKTETEKKCCAQEDSDSACCKNNKIKIEKTTSENVLVKTFQLDLVTLNNVSFWQPTSLFAFEEIVTKSENPSFYCDTHAPPLYQLYSQYIFYA